MSIHALRASNMNWRLLASALISGLWFAAPMIGPAAFAADMPVAQNALPDPVRQILAAKYPGWTVGEATRIEGVGRAQYRIRLTDATTEIDVVLDEAGHIVEAARGVARTEATQAKPGKPKRDKSKGPEVFGYVQFFFREAFDTSNDGVSDPSNARVQRARIGVQGDINSWASYQVEIDPRAPEVSGILRDAYVDLKVIPNQKIRVGQQKTTFGYENLVSSSELFAVNRTEVADILSRGINLRDIGVGLRGNVDLNNTWQFEDDFTIVNGAGINQQNDNTSKKNLWGRIGVRHRLGKHSWQRIGISGGRGDLFDIGDPADPTDDALINFDRIGIDFEMDHEWFLLSAEYVQGHNTLVIEGGIPVDSPVKEKLDGYYVNLVGKAHGGMWGPIVRYDAFNNVFARWTVGAYWGKPKDKIRAMLNYEYREKFESIAGNVGRGDDKLYLWMQVRF